MKIVLQRSKQAYVKVDDKEVGAIDKGLVLLVGVTHDDTKEAAKFLADKIVNLRIFEDEDGKMNHSLLDVGGDILSVSQFTLYGDCQKGRRPNFMEAEGGDRAKALYERFVELLRETNLKVETGEFGAHMKVDILNDGPVTIILDSKKNF